MTFARSTMRRKSVLFRKLKRMLAVLGAGVVLLTGCSAMDAETKVVFTTGFNDEEVFRIEESVCSLQELMVYLVNTQNSYEKSFGSDLWSYETAEGTVEEKLKNSVLAKLAQIKAMNLLSQEMGIELDEKEMELAEEAASKYYESLSEKDIEAMKGVDLETIIQIYSEYALAEKLYDYIIRDINPEISDDEARTITIEQIFIKTYKLDANGEKVSVSDSEKEVAYLKAKSVRAQLIEGTSFEELMARYNEADESTLSFGKDEMEKAFEEAAFNLGTEDVSDVVEVSDGYVIIKCISTFNREETEANKVRIVEQRKREVFGQQYDSFVATLTKELNEELWSKISLTDSGEVTTDSLWEVYREVFK